MKFILFLAAVVLFPARSDTGTVASRESQARQDMRNSTELLDMFGLLVHVTLSVLLSPVRS